MSRRIFELYREGEWSGDFDLFEDAHREAMCSSRPWQIWATERRGAAPRKIAEGDGKWRATHDLSLPVTRSAHLDRDVCIGLTMLVLMATPDGFLFTEGAWNRGAPPDFRNTGNGIARGHGGPVLVDAVLTARG